QIEAQEDSESLKSPEQGITSAASHTGNCSWNTDGDCVRISSGQPRRTTSAPAPTPKKDVSPFTPGDQQTSPTSPRILQAESGPDGSIYSGAGENQVAFQDVSNPPHGQDVSSGGDSSLPDYLNHSAAGHMSVSGAANWENAADDNLRPANTSNAPYPANGTKP